VGWLHLWPHVKAWTFRRPQPALRCVPDIQHVAELFMQAWTAENPQVNIQRSDVVDPTKSPVSHGRFPIQAS
jgi:hypothetical protein